jgi:hypothetical protein
MDIKYCEWSKGVRCSKERCGTIDGLGFFVPCKYYKTRSGQNKYRSPKFDALGRRL